MTISLEYFTTQLAELLKQLDAQNETIAVYLKKQEEDARTVQELRDQLEILREENNELKMVKNHSRPRPVAQPPVPPIGYGTFEHGIEILTQAYEAAQAKAKDTAHALEAIKIAVATA